MTTDFSAIIDPVSVIRIQVLGMIMVTDPKKKKSISNYYINDILKLQEKYKKDSSLVFNSFHIIL